MTTKKLTPYLLLPFWLTVPSFGQITQNHPELCGKSDSEVTVPPTISAAVDRWTGQGDLFIKNGDSAKKISLPGVVDEVEQVCPISNHRFVLFGSAGHMTNIDVVDSASASLLDSFYGGDPIISPDKQWLIYRKFYPRHTDLPVSEEYLRYDLTKTAAQNRPPSITPDDHDDVGQPIFPGHSGILVDSRQEIESATVKVDSGFEIGFVAEAAGSILDPTGVQISSPDFWHRLKAKGKDDFDQLFDGPGWGCCPRSSAPGEE